MQALGYSIYFSSVNVMLFFTLKKYPKMVRILNLYLPCLHVNFDFVIHWLANIMTTVLIPETAYQ